MSQIRSGPASVVDSGVVTTFAGHGLELTVALAGDHLVIELVFESDGTGAPGVSSAETDRGYRIVCTNFDDAAGRGSAEPVLLGEIDQDLFFFHFRVARYGRSADHTVFYTLFRTAKQDVGWTPR